MSPREKAIQLHRLIRSALSFNTANQRSKQCALIAVDEIMDALDKNGGGWDSKYWEEVKAEIEKL